MRNITSSNNYTTPFPYSTLILKSKVAKYLLLQTTTHHPIRWSVLDLFVSSLKFPHVLCSRQHRVISHRFPHILCIKFRCILFSKFFCVLWSGSVFVSAVPYFSSLDSVAAACGCFFLLLNKSLLHFSSCFLYCSFLLLPW